MVLFFYSYKQKKGALINFSSFTTENSSKLSQSWDGREQGIGFWS